MRHPLHAAAGTLRMLGAIYLATAAMPALTAVLNDWSVRTVALTALAVSPGVLYVAAAGALARRRRGGLLALAGVVATLVAIGIVMLLAWFATQVGVNDLLLRPRNIGVGHFIALVLLALIAFHGWTVYQLVRAYDAPPPELPEHGYAPFAEAMPPPPIPLRVVPVDDPDAAPTAPPASPPPPT
jgi:hypothetical protein